MSNHIEIIIEIEDKELHDSIFTSIQIEQQHMNTHRGNLSIESEHPYLKIKIETSDLVAARAYSNSILRLIKTSLDVANVLN